MFSQTNNKKLNDLHFACLNVLSLGGSIEYKIRNISCFPEIVLVDLISEKYLTPELSITSVGLSSLNNYLTDIYK